MEAEYGADGSVDRLSADFEQHCEGLAAALTGSIRFRASSTFAPPPDADADSVADSADNCPEVANRSQSDGDRDRFGDACDGLNTITSLRTSSGPGERIGRGVERTRYSDEGPFAADSRGGVRVFVHGGSYNEWSLVFEAPVGEELRPGSYEGATRHPLPPPGQPGLSVNSSGRGCNTSIGRFEVLEVAVGEQTTTAFCANLPPDDLPLDDDPSDNNPFDDDDASVFQAVIECLAYAGVTSGGPGGTGPRQYGPDLAVTREQMASFINRSHELLTGSALVGSGDHFSDDDGSSHQANIEAMATAGIAVGDGRGSFGPERAVTRGQMAAFLIRHLAVVQESGQIIPLRG